MAGICSSKCQFLGVSNYQPSTVLTNIANISSSPNNCVQHTGNRPEKLGPAPVHHCWSRHHWGPLLLLPSQSHHPGWPISGSAQSTSRTGNLQRIRSSFNDVFPIHRDLCRYFKRSMECSEMEGTSSMCRHNVSVFPCISTSLWLMSSLQGISLDTCTATLTTRAYTPLSVLQECYCILS